MKKLQKTLLRTTAKNATNNNSWWIKYESAFKLGYKVFKDLLGLIRIIDFISHIFL